MADFTLYNLVSGYERRESGERDFFVRNISGSVTGAKRLSGSRLERACLYLSRLVSYTTARAWGMLLLGFGLLSVIINFVKDYLNLYDGVPLSSLIAGAVISIIAIPLITVDKPIAIASQDYILTDYIVHEFFCIKRMHRDGAQRGISPAVMLVIGLVLAGVGYFLPMPYMIFGTVGLLYLYLAFTSPEFSFLAIFLVMPYLTLLPHHELILGALVLVTLFSYGRKVLLGKRVFALEQYDIVLFLMLIFVLISGIFIKGIESFESSVTMILLAMGYILAGNLVTNRRLADCVIHAVIISSVPISVMSTVQFVSAAVAAGALPEGVSATFGSPEVLAVYMIVVVAFSLYFAIGAATVGGKILYSLISLLSAAALFSTLCANAVLAALFGLLALLAVRARRGSGILLGLLSALPYAVLLLPVSLAEKISPALAALVSRWHISLRMLGDNLFTGVGMGADSFREEYFKYSGEYADSSSSFILEIGVEAGIFALALFLVIVLVRLVHRTRYRLYVRNSQVRDVAYITSSALVALLAFGSFSYIWADMTMYYLFWCVFGLGSAAMRIAKREHDDRVGYFVDGSSLEASSIDITLR
ncbi:MAG: hypothetical protein IKA64_05425 [Clostridia bacterium]|nr:hypothetical protein [Clostridia bacterium]